VRKEGEVANTRDQDELVLGILHRLIDTQCDRREDEGPRALMNPPKQPDPRLDDDKPLAKVLPMYLDGTVRDEDGQDIGHISYRRGLPRDQWPKPEESRAMFRGLQALVEQSDEPPE
jgi:hypothetical protein